MRKAKLYLNENLSWRIARALRGYGYDVVSSHEIEMNAESDPVQFDFAVSQGRAVVTNNFKDFAELHQDYVNRHQQHYGIIFTANHPLSLMIQRLRRLLETVSEEQLRNQIRWLNEIG